MHENDIRAGVRVAARNKVGIVVDYAPAYTLTGNSYPVILRCTDGSRLEVRADECVVCNDSCDGTPPKQPTAEEAAKTRRESFRAASLPLMTWLAENANPHAVAHVDAELAELLEGALVVPRKL